MIVNSFWLGETITPLNELCIESWLKKGCSYNLYTYGKINTNLNVNILDANQVVSKKEYFTYHHGISKRTPVAFSNLFRAELLYQKGGLYIDTDVMLIKPIELEEYTFCYQYHPHYSTSIGTCFLYSKYANSQLFKRWADIIRDLSKGYISHGDLGPDLFTNLILAFNMLEFVKDKSLVNPIDYTEIQDLLNKPKAQNYLHLFNSIQKGITLEKINDIKKYYEI